jgi:hypothetical protein
VRRPTNRLKLWAVGVFVTICALSPIGAITGVVRGPYYEGNGKSDFAFAAAIGGSVLS